MGNSQSIREPEVAKWQRRLGDQHDCSQYYRTQVLGPLLSKDLSFEDKVKIQLHLSKTLLSRDGGIFQWERIERGLERSGQVKLLQLFRFQIMDSNEKEGVKGKKWAQTVVERDVEERWLGQRETFLLEEIRALEKELGLNLSNSNCAVQLRSYESQLKDVRRQFETFNQQRWFFEENTPGGPVQRALTTLRQDRDWYLSDWLRKDCAGRGGCCGRDCGCCQHERDTTRILNRGHCTSACGCCVRHRGETGHAIHFNDLKTYQFGLEKDHKYYVYSERLVRAYIFGIEFLDRFE